MKNEQRGDVMENFEAKEVTTIKRLRSVQAIHQMLKEQDEETAVTEYLVRKLVYEGDVPSVLSGNKRLACYEDVADYLYQGKRWPA